MLKKSLGLVLTFVALLIAGCSSSPPDDIVKSAAVRAYYPLVGEEVWKDIQKGDMSLTKFKITNDYVKTIKDEQVYFYEVSLEITDNSTHKVHGRGQTSFGITKRGNSWYFVK